MHGVLVGRHCERPGWWLLRESSPQRYRTAWLSERFRSPWLNLELVSVVTNRCSRDRRRKEEVGLNGKLIGRSGLPQIWAQTSFFQVEPGEDEQTNPGCY